MRCQQALVLFLIAALWLVVTPVVSATDARAVELAQEASALSRQDDFDGAIEKLQAAIELAPTDARISFQLAGLFAMLGRFEEAGPIFEAVVALDPENGAARRGEITAVIFQGRYRDARKKLEDGLTALPRDGQLAHTLARLVATAPLDDVRDGALALQLAAKVYEVVKNFETAETIAMAHAELGQFDEAVELQRGLIAEAKRTNDNARLDGLNKRLLAYLDKKPWRATSPSEIAMATEAPRAPKEP